MANCFFSTISGSTIDAIGEMVIENSGMWHFGIGSFSFHPGLVELQGIELEDRCGLSITDQLNPTMVDTLLRAATLIIPR